MNIAKEWKDYEILDMANGEKLERWKDVVLVRPDPQIIWKNKSFPEKWKNVMSSRFNGKKYMLLYMLRPMPELLEFAKNVAHKKNLDLLYIGDYFIDDNDVESCHDAGVEDFLSAIYSAEYIVTNSFHATVFSILFKKMFCSYAVSRTGTRVRDFLQDVGLQKCQLENFNSAQFEFYSEMDWNAVFAHVASQRETSMKYVEQIVRQDK